MTNRIQLRPWRESDAEALFKYASDPDVGTRAGWPPHKSVDETLAGSDRPMRVLRLEFQTSR